MGVNNDLVHVVGFYYVKISDVSSMTKDIYQGLVSVTLEGGVSWTEVGFTPGTMKFNSEQDRSVKEGSLFSHSFNAQMPGKVLELPGSVKALTDEPILCMLSLSNGKYLVIGDTGGGVKMESQFRSAENDTLFSFKHKNEHAPLVLDV